MTLTWDELSSHEALREEHEQRALQDRGYGPANYKAKLRLFDAPPDTKPRITFYHDHNVWCPFCETLWLYLEEKRIPYKAVTVNKEPHGKEGGSSPEELNYWRMGASGVPGFQIDGGKLHSGADLMTIEAEFRENPLIPVYANEPAAERWHEMEELSEAFNWCGFLRQNIRGPVLDSNPYKQFAQKMDRLDQALQSHGGPWLCGERFTILDVQAARDGGRAAGLLPYFKGVKVRRNPRWPHIEKWFVAMEGRPSFKAISGDFYTHFSATPLQVPFLCGPKHPDSDKISAMMDGSDGVSWTLPLPEDDGTLLEPINSLGVSSSQARAEAAERVIHNHRGLVGFAARGVKDAHAKEAGSRDPEYAKTYGKQVPPTQSGAEVCTTNLGPKYGGKDELVAAPEVTSDILLRHTVSVLLNGPSEKAKAAVAADRLSAGDSKAMLSYVRDRISVPRDMSGPAARQLRAHLNWVIAAVEGADVHTSTTSARPIDSARSVCAC